MGEHVIFAIRELGGRLRVAAFPANRAPLPFGAEIITRVADADFRMMMLWTKRRAKRGWSIEKMKAACE